MGMPQREVVVNGHKYRFYLISGSLAFQASRKILAKLTSMLNCFQDKATNELNAKISELAMEDFDELFNTFIDKNNIYCDGSLITDFDEHFAGRFMDIPQLLYKVILENDKDFFTSLPTLIQKGMHTLNERLQANSLPKAEGLEKALNQVANNLNQNLG